MQSLSLAPHLRRVLRREVSRQLLEHCIVLVLVVRSEEVFYNLVGKQLIAVGKRWNLIAILSVETCSLVNVIESGSEGKDYYNNAYRYD